MKKLICLAMLLLSKQGLSLTLNEVTQLAIENDQQSIAMNKQAAAWQAGGSSVNIWPNPTVNLGLMNVATDGFDIGQEAMSMSQLKVTQRLPKRKLVHIQKQQATQQAVKQSQLHKARLAQLRQQVGNLWLQAHLAQEKLVLLEQQKTWLQQLTTTVSNHYQTGRINTQQADVLQVQLATTSIEEQLIIARQEKQGALLSLGIQIKQNIEHVSGKLPKTPETINEPQYREHPKLVALQYDHQIAELNIKSTTESQKSNWAISAAYGHRQDDSQAFSGSNSRPDLASIGFSFDVPFFNRNNNKSRVRQAALISDAVQANWEQALLDMQSQWAQALNLYQSQDELLTLFQDQLIPASQSVIDALMTAYSNGRSGIEPIIKAQQQLINQKISAVTALHQQAQSTLTLAYFQTTGVEQ